jgi:AraC-like DNA-binding protein
MLNRYFNNVENTIQYNHIINPTPEDIDFHLHDRFEIYFFVSGDVNYFIEKSVYPLKHGDLLIINNNEIHRPTFQSDKMYERIMLHFDPSIISTFASPHYNLLHCFTGRQNGEQNKIKLDSTQLDYLQRKLHKIESIVYTPSQGSDLLLLTNFLELLVYINNVFTSNTFTTEHPNVPEKLIPILDYIEEHLDSDLSLDFFQNNFYINKHYLSRLFKTSTGSNIHEYIVYKRLSKARQLLLNGYSVTEVCQMSGFNDYTNFIRTFKKVIGTSPGQYKKRHTVLTK